MRARRILQKGAFSPDDVIRLQEALDITWETVARFVETADHARLRELVAAVVLTAGNVSGLDAEELAAVAIRTVESTRPGSQSLL
jgi:hypothetical protein